MNEKKSGEPSKQSLGGKMRAERLSGAERSAIARQAAVSRWNNWREGEVVHATHVGEIKLGDIMLACANLPDERRVVSEAAMLTALGRGYSGYYSQRDAAAGPGAAVLPRYLAPKVLRPFISEELQTLQPIPYVVPGAPGGSVSKGLLAQVIPEICEVWMKAREAGVLSEKQLVTAGKAEMIVLGLARVGIIALIDEATGYQYERQRDALQELLEEFLSDRLRRWVKTFPASYFRELCRLRGVHYRADMKLPQYFGHLTNDIVYKRLHPDVLDELQKLNPKEDGKRKARHHQWLSSDVGHPALLRHLGAVVGLMKISKTYDEFKALLDKVAPISTEMPLFARINDD